MRWALAGAIVAAALPVAGHGATAPTAAVLLARHAPVLVLHPDERFAPSGVEPFLAASDLLRRQPDGTWVAEAATALPVAGGPWRLDVRGCSPQVGLPSLDCYATAMPASASERVVYGAVHRRPGRTILQYWLFYPYNLYSPSVPQRPDLWQAHEGDWEMVSVVLGADARPLYAAASRHCNGVRRDWGRVERRGARPVVYVALGSHANGFAAGTRVVDRACWPQEALAIYKAYDVVLRDFAAVGRTVRPRVVPVTAAAPPWMAFTGTWGETQYVGFPTATLAYGTGPTGPATKTAWREPLSIARWGPG